MGIIRLLLALAVVVSHNISIFGWTLTGSIIAVQAFYVISGFYMGLILNEKYSFKNYFLFISNRLLRLLPVYWTLLLLMTIVSFLWFHFSDSGNTLFFDNYFAKRPSLSFSAWVFVVAADLLIVFQDLFLFLGISDNGGFEFIANFQAADRPLSDLLIIPQAWTVGLEILFYFLVPFIVRLANKYIILLALLSLTFRLIAYSQGLNFDPWTYRFFPFEMFYFLIGILSFRLYLFISKKSLSRKINFVLFNALWIFIVTYQFIPIDDLVKKILFFIFLSLTLPFVFIYFKKSTADRFIGEFSYPVYLSHVFVAIITGIISSKFIHMQKQTEDIVVLVGTLAFSFFLIRFVSEPVEQLRQKRVAKARK